MQDTQNRLKVSLPATFNPRDEVLVPRLMSAPEVAEYLGLTRMQISRLVKAGKIRALKFGTARQASIRFLVSELLEDLQAMRVVSSPRGGTDE